MDVDEKEIYFRSRRMSLVICLPFLLLILFIMFFFFKNIASNALFGFIFALLVGVLFSNVIGLIKKILLKKEQTGVEDNRNWFYKLVNFLSDYM